MNKDRFAELKNSVREMIAIEAGEVKPARVTTFEDPDVVAIRKRLAITQEEFAGLLGISVRTLQEWEQGRRSPRGPARALLWVADHDPQAVLDGVRAAAR